MMFREVAYGTVILTITLNPMNGQKQTPRCQENRKKLKKVLELQITTATNNWENYGRNSTSLIGATVLAHGIFGDNQMGYFAGAIMIVNGWIKTWNVILKKLNGKFM